MKKKTLCAILTAVLVVVLAAAAFLYTRPVDVYGIDGKFEPEIISISLVRSDADGSEAERFAYFEAGDAGYDEALETVNSLRFRRPLTNLIPGLAKVERDSSASSPYSIYLHMGEQGEDWAVYLSCWADRWDYWDAGRKASLPLTAEGAAADAKALGDLWWAIATPLDSYDIENME